jgi:Putative motility protein
MDSISSASSVAPVTGAIGSLQATAGISVMKKAANLQANAVATLLDGLQQAPQLASSGSVGTRVNTYA